MPIIIDGWNFIRHEISCIDDDRDDSLQSAKSLIVYLEKFQRTHADPIIVVLDSRREFIDLGYRNKQSLKVVPSRDADEYIKRYIAQVPERQRRNLRVVSSDNSIYYYAKDYHAAPLRCEEFWDKLSKSVRRDDEEMARR